MKKIVESERVLRERIDEVRSGRMSRRAFIEAVVGMGLTAPMASMMLAHSGVGDGAGAVHLQAHQARRRRAAQAPLVAGPTLLNPHFAQGLKDQDASRDLLRAARGLGWRGQPGADPRREIPSLENGGVARDFSQRHWKLKRNVRWHDGKPFTAADVVFNAQYAADPRPPR
jgi:peptide/nickel transport system substrate-binding protein